MNFYFCETCGRRLTDEDLNKGLGRNKKLKGVYCQGCAEGVLTIETLAIQDMTAKGHALKEDAAPIPASDPRRPIVTHRPVAPSREKAALATSSSPLLIAGAIVAVIAGTGVIALSGGGKTQKAAAAKLPEVQKEVSSSSKAPEPAIVSAQPRLVPAPKVWIAPPEPEQISREAPPITVEPPPVAARPLRTSSSETTTLLPLPLPEAGDEAWKQIFNRKDLTGLSSAKGVWRVQNEMILGSATSGDARLDTTTSFGDGEFVCELASGNSKYTTVRVRENVVYKIDLPPGGKWVAFRVVAVGDKVEASIDGATLQPASRAAPGAIGSVRIFVGKPYSIMIRNMRWRDISRRDLPQK
jgi:hypothetical protein